LASGVSNKGKKSDFARLVTDGIVDNRPDMYNYVPKRVVEKSEAEKMGWIHYYDGHSMCVNGHVAARYVSNTAICVDCKRLAEGKPAIYSPGATADSLIGIPDHVNPIANSKFAWTDDKKSQLLSAWVNTGGDMIAAAKIVGCQPEHVIDLKASDPDFQAAYEAARLKVDQVQLWSMESRGSGNDRVGLAMAQSKFIEFGAKQGLADRPAINPEQMRAELANMLSSLKRSADQRERLKATIRASRGVGSTDTPAADSADAGVEIEIVLGSPYDGSDLV
jgi:hypothetical protein